MHCTDIKLWISLPFLGLMFCQGYAQRNPLPKPLHQFTVISHRGDHVNYPENTLAAFEQAIKDSADYIEIDLRTTKDGKLICLHDGTVNRMTNGTGAVKDLTWKEIEALKINSSTPSAQQHYAIPTFEEILKLCKNKIYIYIDFKEADAAIVYQLLKQHGMQNQVLVYINKPEQFTDWRRVSPKMPLMLSLPNEVKDTVAMIAFINQYHPDILDGSFEQYNSEMVKYAKTQHLNVWPDGQSPSEDQHVWGEAIMLGLDGLQTDHPELLINYLRTKSKR